MASVSLSRIIEKFKLENLTPEIETKGIKITQPDINRPALQLAGYFEHYEATRLQIIGFVEYTYMNSLTEERKEEIFEKLLSNPIPVIVFCRELQPDPLFLKKAVEHKIPLLMTETKEAVKEAEAVNDKESNLCFYGRSDPLAECKAGTVYFRTRRTGGCIR